DRTRGVPAAGRPGDDRRLRGLERRRRGGEHGAGAPGAHLGRRAAGLDRPRGVLRLPGHAAARALRRRRHPQDRVADDPTVGGDDPGHRAARGARQRHRAEPALALVLRRTAGPRGAPRRDQGHHAGRPAHRHPAHPAHERQRDLLRHVVGGRAAGGALDLPGTHRHRRRPAERLRRGRGARDVVLGVGAALRVPGPRAQGGGGAAAARRGGARRGGAAGCAARAGRGVGAHRLGDGRGRRRGARVRAPARGAGRGGRRRAPRGRRRRDRRGLRALPAPPRHRRRGLL
ncbi:MAG: PFIG00823557: AC2 (Proteasome assembly chaperone) family, partial [uncultured Pseudonocardia sp.]